jgi:hypothetical protein
MWFSNGIVRGLQRLPELWLFYLRLSNFISCYGIMLDTI